MTTDTPPPLAATLDDPVGAQLEQSRQDGSSSLEDPAGDLIDADQVAESFTGFDEIAIRQAFRTDLSDMGETTQLRAIWFVLRRRAGATDVEAYREAMTSTLGQLVPHFKRKGKASDPGEG